jgi:hypothetical protein
MKTIARYLVGLAVAALSFIWVQTGDGRYVKSALADYPVWQTNQVSECQSKLGGATEECECLITSVLAWDTDQNKPSPNADIWDHAFIQASYYSDDWNDGTMDTSVDAAFMKELGRNSDDSDKYEDLWNRFFDQALVAVTFNCFTGDKVYDLGSDEKWDDLVDVTDYTYMVGRAAAERGLSN